MDKPRENGGLLGYIRAWGAGSLSPIASEIGQRVPFDTNGAALLLRQATICQIRGK
jgi:hypothetical protein